nr:oligosaccharide flippase family protein [uncultured Niameybacter sp.]
MKRYLAPILNNKFFMSFSLLVSGSVIAQLIGILISPITTRIFTPEQMGGYTLITTAVSLFGPVICLKYDMAIIVAKSEKETFALIKMCFILIAILSLCISIVYGTLIGGSNSTGHRMVVNTISVFLLLLLYGINNILLAYNNQKSLYKTISSVTIIKSAVNNVMMILTGLLGMGTIGLIISQVLGYIAGFNKQSNELIKHSKEIVKIKSNYIKEMIFIHRKQPIYNASSALITTSIYSTINIFIKAVYSVETLGLYSLSYRVLGIPFSIISANISRIFFESAAKEKNTNDNFKRIYIRTFIGLCSIMVPSMLMLALIAPTIFKVVFGKEWYLAGVFVRLLTPMFAVRLIAESLTTSFIVSGKQQKELMFQIILLGSEIGIYLIVYLFNIPIEIFLILISIVYVVIYTIEMIYMYKISK